MYGIHQILSIKRTSRTIEVYPQILPLQSIALFAELRR